MAPQHNGNADADTVQVSGIFEPTKNNTGQLLDAKRYGKTRPTDPFIPRELVRRFKLKAGMEIVAQAQQDKRFANPKVRFIETIDGLTPEERKRQYTFQQLTTITPDEWLPLEHDGGPLTLRMIDLFCPVGKGQRGLIVAPPRTGKTTLLHHIAAGLLENHKDVHVMCLLVDERPEEVTDMVRGVPIEVWASSNDEQRANHLRIAELAIERARRLVEAGRDVVLLLDSITRLSRAYNANKGGGGRTMSGGLDIRALEKPRQLFSAARNTEEAGSLTIMATALVETGSRMDDLIFQEFKGTGNMEMVLDRKVAELRLWPAMNIASSGTRKEELLLKGDVLEKSRFFRRALAGQKIEDAAELAIGRLEKTKSNAELFALVDAKG